MYYPNNGEIRFANEEQGDAIRDVKYYTMNTYPKRFLLSTNNMALSFAKGDTSSADSLHRIDLEWKNSLTSAFLATVDVQSNAMLNYFTPYFGSGGRTNVQGSAAIACQSVYHNIDLVYTSNTAGPVMYFIVYPGGNFNDIVMHINGSRANSINSSGKLEIDANWESMTLEKPQMYQYTLSGGTVTPLAVCNASWVSTGSNNYQIGNTTSYNSSLPLVIQIKQANVTTAIHTTGLNWSTYFGGGQNEFPMRTHTDANDNLYVAGYTVSNNFPQAFGAQGNPVHIGDAFIAKFDNAGRLMWSTYMGGNGNDEIHDMDFNGGNVYCVGKTSSTDIVTKTKFGASPNYSVAGGGWDGFIFQFNFNALNQVSNTWLTYYGGNGDDELNGVKFDALGSMFVVGESASTDLNGGVAGPSGSYQHGFNSAQLNPSTPLSTDAIIAKFDVFSSQSWFTFYGTDALGTNAHNHAGDYFYGLTIAGTDIYACGKSGGTNLPNSTNSKIVSGNFDGILAHFTTGGVMNSGDAKYTDGNIANYSVKIVLGKVYTVGQANSAMNGNTTNSSLYYFNGTAAGTTDGCFSVHNVSNLSTIHNTFLGGNDEDYAYDLQFTSNGLFYIVGGTKSSDFPTHSLATMYNNTTGNPNSGVYLWDNFVSCFQEGNTNPTWSTYLGSELNEAGFLPTYINTANWPAVATIALDSQNFPYVLGISNSNTTFPLDEWTGTVTGVYFQSSKSSYTMAQYSNDATITRFNSVAINTIVGIKDFENTKIVLGVYPNPTTKELLINNAAIANDDLRYAVYDLSGKKLKEGKLKAADSKGIDVSLLPQGTYVINVTNEKVTLSSKFVKTDN